MFTKTKKGWIEFWQLEPGRRFQRRYRRRQESGHGKFHPWRLFNIVVGTLLVVVSTFFGWAPGPGMLTLFIGFGMIAGEFRPAARFLDWGEVEGRKLARWTRNVWEASSNSLRALIFASILVCVAVPLYTGYQALFGG
ncbi:MAG: PGPGW domain-containing protein [Rubrobacteraceae bacterium]